LRIFTFIILLSLNVWGEYLIPQDSEVLKVVYPGAPMPSLNTHFKMLSWNVQKGEGKNDWFNDFMTLKTVDVISLQEAMIDDFMPQAFAALNPFQTIFAKSFIHTDPLYATGVAISSATAPLSSFYRRSPGTEPFTDTPKMSLFEVFRLSNGNDLLIVNIHGINFVTTSTFEEQINDLAPFIAKFPGPVIFAGDFNTWNFGRTDFLLKLTQKLGLQHIQFKNDTRNLHLDHVFAKGCKAVNAELHNQIESSDHYPITVEWNCDSDYARN
jgi:endonuclease/exonuclease/phosphatase (EEP) superfamily protein YafD